MSAFAAALIAPARLAILRCPSCAAAEPVDEASLAGPAHMITCRRCGETWPARQGFTPHGDQSSGAVMDHRMSSPPWRERAVDAVRTPLGAYHDAGLATWSARIVADRPAAPVAPLPWAVPLCCLLAMIFLTALVTGRQGAVAAVPDLAGLYSAVGLAVHVTGLAVQDVDAERRVDGTGATIKVRGRVVNHGTGDLAVPPLILEFQDTTGAILHGSIAAAPVARLSAGGTATFVVEVERVPSEAGQVVVRLQDAP